VSLSPEQTIGSNEVFWRFVTSFESKAEQIDQVIALAKR